MFDEKLIILCGLIEVRLEKIENSLLRLQKCMEVSISSNGDNKYMRPYLNKELHRNKNKPIKEDSAAYMHTTMLLAY